MKKRDMDVYNISFQRLLNEKYFIIETLEPTTSGPSSSNDEATSNIKRRSPTISPDPYRGYDSGTYISLYNIIICTHYVLTQVHHHQSSADTHLLA